MEKAAQIVSSRQHQRFEPGSQLAHYRALRTGAQQILVHHGIVRAASQQRRGGAAAGIPRNGGKVSAGAPTGARGRPAPPASNQLEFERGDEFLTLPAILDRHISRLQTRRGLTPPRRAPRSQRQDLDWAALGPLRMEQRTRRWRRETPGRTVSTRARFERRSCRKNIDRNSV